MAKPQLAAKLADWLGETEEEPRRRIGLIVDRCGADFAYATCMRTFVIEGRGGMQRRFGKGRRTPGGVFFRLVKGKLGRDEYYRLVRGPNPEGFKGVPPARPERLGRCRQQEASAE